MTDLRALRVATANAASGRGAGGRPALDAWAEDAARLELDVLAVQEVDYLLPRSGTVDQASVLAAACARGCSPWTVRFAAAVLGTPGPERGFGPAAGGEHDAGTPSYGVAILSRHPVRAWSEMRMNPSRASLPVPNPAGGLLWAPDEHRVALAAVVAAPGGDVTVVGTHLSFVPNRAASQLRQLRRWVRELPRPLVLLGDLNLPGVLPAALTSWKPLVRAPTFPCGGPRLQLDHILLDPGDSGATGESSGAHALGGSDHLALIATLHLD